MHLFFELPLLTKLLLIYIVAINIITFFYFGFDKIRSQMPGKRRIPEKTLWLLSLCGGSVGALLGMNYFRHKTKKTSFQLTFTLILLVQIFVALYLLQY